MATPGLFRARRREATDGFPVLRLQPRERADTIELFIDTSCWLGVHLLSAKDLAQLEGLVSALAQQRIRLHAPEALLAEHRRQRALLFAGLVSSLQPADLGRPLPYAFRHGEYYEALCHAEGAYVRARANHMQHLTGIIDGDQLASDRLLQRVFPQAYRAPASRALRRKAGERYALCNPPADQGGRADALVWEVLLATLPRGSLLHLVSDAATYNTEGDEQRFNGFLLDEWRERTGGDIAFYPTLWQFFERMLPEVALVDAARLDAYIDAFVEAPTPRAQAHAARVLETMPDFSAAQLDRIVGSVIERPGRGALGEGEAVRALLMRLAFSRGVRANPHTLEVLRDALLSAVGPDSESE
jgi:hypothetical protein